MSRPLLDDPFDHFGKRLVNTVRRQCRGLKEGCSIDVSERGAISRRHLPVPFKIVLVATDTQHQLVPVYFAVELIDPAANGIKALRACDIIHHHRGVGLFVIQRSHCPVSLLPCRVPYVQLQMHAFDIKLFWEEEAS
eukprot:CAMPEP_0182918228 /NCGR_PEP_ID=MMETSP0105_2-20130417/1967_1 /TAXON_ID=81532 ORGANISM="Acanthoeca-like sp., Strain 10tr" /NCGR_SAMPLE_ID=MMETSP0105_2 /ASSEMBLY_ACC=CAM_ASM_000205 /LENGTH=136 /DNA_ID=CAMNT_0025055293 /DNA_START=487 /DNA_END=897 /DNA_ORIENTATION=-